MHSNSPWKKISGKLEYDGFVRVSRSQFEEPAGTVSAWDVIVSSDTAAALVFTEDLSLLLFEQFRVGPERILRELPGGYLEDGEDPVAAAARECLEETGYEPELIVSAGSEWWAANSNRRKHLAIGINAKKTREPQWDASEMGNVRLLPRDRGIDFLTSGEATDSGLACRGMLRFLSERHSDPRLIDFQGLLRDAVCQTPSPEPTW
ncbi:NUDIX hydrolase [Lysinibacter sp. HNR]|uniref:NUDIX hydrolase n=1 Tax=Lysinibacter sp. HNR TaxID=3031408 RepID=UPI0024354627|nr:NUDIX hydrolase [Lysinibacter sp. HNR]WGD37503.1 NUDIX hydrolase [Lysinibacter sp. HNR]